MLKIKVIFSLFLIFLFFFPFSFVLAQGNQTNEGALNEAWGKLKNVGKEAGLKEQDLPILIGKIVNIILGFLGLIAVIIIIVGGFLWMSSGGNPEKIKKAKSLMINALIGIIIIVFSFAIVNFILNQISQVQKTGPGVLKPLQFY